MSVDVAVGTPLAEALQQVVLPKLVEVGWSTGLQDDTLSEYIILMLANGKSQEQIASELSNDLLDLGPNDQGAVDFAKWLFDQVQSLATQLNVPTNAASGSNGVAAEGDAPVGDADMGEAADGTAGAMYAAFTVATHKLRSQTNSASSPTGPKSMRNGKTRDKRMLGQLNKSLERGGDPLHRIRGAGGAGRINSHSRGGDPPRGPRQQQVQRGLAAANGRPMQGMPGMPVMPQMGGMPPNGPHFQQQQPQQPGMITLQPQQFQHMLAMMEEQANMMAQLTGQGLGGFQGPGQFQQQQHNGRPLSERVDRRGRQGQDRRQQNHGASQQSHTQQDVAMGEDGEPKNGEAGEGSEKEQKDTAEIMCKFNQTCSRADCPYAHQGPYSTPHIAVDTSVVCSFGVRCTNKNCASRHPSPAKKVEDMKQADCRFGANCANTFCLFKHPDKKACRHGADCTVPECPFWHNPQMCKYTDGCTYAQCPYKHAEGQKKVRGPIKNKVWAPNGANGQQEHVSDRKFVEDENVEEQIIPGRTEEESDMQVL
jgi:hypothetical protein